MQQPEVQEEAQLLIRKPGGAARGLMSLGVLAAFSDRRLVKGVSVGSGTTPAGLVWGAGGTSDDFRFYGTMLTLREIIGDPLDLSAAAVQGRLFRLNEFVEWLAGDLEKKFDVRTFEDFKTTRPQAKSYRTSPARHRSGNRSRPSQSACAASKRISGCPSGAALAQRCTPHSGRPARDAGRRDPRRAGLSRAAQLA